MRKKVKFVNCFHKTEAFAMAKVQSTGNLTLNEKQVKNVCNKLCGMKDCCCGGIYGKQENDFIFHNNVAFSLSTI